MSGENGASGERSLHDSEVAHLVLPMAPVGQQVVIVEPDEKVDLGAPGSVQLWRGVLREEGVGQGDVLGAVGVSHLTHAESLDNLLLAIYGPREGVETRVLDFLRLAGELDPFSDIPGLCFELPGSIMAENRCI